MTSETNLRSSLDLVEVKPGKQWSKADLVDLLPDIETTLFFGKVYNLDGAQLGKLLSVVHDTPLVQALTQGDHSVDLQDYVLGTVVPTSNLKKGDVSFGTTPPPAELLPLLWEQLEVEIADSVKAVASKLENVVGMLPGKQGHMIFQSMRVMNAKRASLGDYKAAISHARVKDNLLILDVSSSMSRTTIEAIVNDVVALSYKANAHMAVVSNTATHWEPGEYDVASVLAASEFGGTHYESLAGLFDRDWGTVITVADYDSSVAAGEYLAESAGRVGTVIDVSLVNRPTYLAECIGPLADHVRPILVGNSPRVLGSPDW